MKDQTREIEMALLEQLCKVVDGSAMEGYHAKSGKLEPEFLDNKKEVYDTGAGKPADKNWGVSKEDLYEDDNEPDEDDPIAKLRKLAKQKETQGR